MLLSVPEVEILSLLRWCKYISTRDMTGVFEANVISELVALGLIHLHDKSGAYVLTKRGHRLLEDHLDALPEFVSLSYTRQDIRRRVNTAKIVLTAYRAGLSVFHTEISSLQKERSFFLTSLSRKRGSNPWGSARVAALARLGGQGYAFHYICPDIGKLCPEDEERLLSNNTAQIGLGGIHLVFIGESYQSVLSELKNTAKPSSAGLVHYGEAYRTVRKPIHLMACNDVGAIQLAVMAQPDYRRRLAQAIMGKSYSPPSEGHPEWDAMYKGSPLVVTVDMEPRRVKAAIRSAREGGHREILLFGLKEQSREILTPRYAKDDFVKVFNIRESALEAIGVSGLYTPAKEQFKTPKGDVIDAPLIQAHRKMGGLRRK